MEYEDIWCISPFVGRLLALVPQFNSLLTVLSAHITVSLPTQTYIQSMSTCVCVQTCSRVYTKERKSFSIASCPTRLPRRSWGGGQRHYSAIKLLFAGVTLSGGCVDRGGNALKVHSYIHIHTYPSGRGFGGLGSWLWLPGLMGHNRGQKGSRRVSQKGGSKTPEDTALG